MQVSMLISVCAFVSVHSFTAAPSVHRRPSPFSLSSAPSLNNQQEVQETSEITNKKSWKDDGFVFGLSDSGLQRPKGKVAMTVVDGDSLETKPYQVVLVLSTFLGHVAFFMHAMMGIYAQQNYQLGPATLQVTSLTLASWVLADLGSGILHWSVDNYGNGRTPIMGGIIAAFQGHHSAPWTITQRGFCNNVYKLCLPFGLAPVTLLTLLGAGPQAILFATTFCALEILSQEFHKWSHMLGSETPGWVNSLQALGLTVSRKTHGLHHLAPYEGNYSIISGVTNRVLDQTGFFRRLEHLIYRWNGVEANAWKLDAELKERTLRGDYSLRKG
jgi:ubiquitin-conjugating enzyme E2 variant